jgi:hypothetical protein
MSPRRRVRSRGACRTILDVRMGAIVSKEAMRRDAPCRRGRRHSIRLQRRGGAGPVRTEFAIPERGGVVRGDRLRRNMARARPLGDEPRRAGRIDLPVCARAGATLGRRGGETSDDAVAPPPASDPVDRGRETKHGVRDGEGRTMASGGGCGQTSGAGWPVVRAPRTLARVSEAAKRTSRARQRARVKQSHRTGRGST